MLKKLSVLLAIAVASFTAVSQELLWDVDMRAIFDNREGDTKYAAAQTFFLTQLSPEIGLSLLDGQHSVFGGLTWTQPIGSEWEGYRISPTVYYMYHRGGMTGFLGMFPRKRLYKEVPDYIWNDSTYYVQHTVRGAGIINTGKHGFIQALLDWRGRQTATQREAFSIIAMGEWYKSEESFISLGGTAMMNHLACREGAPDGESVIDNFLVNPYVGFNFAKWLPAVKTFRVDAGILAALDRDRALDNKWRCPVGFWMDVRFRWRFLSFREELYAGKKFFPFYDVYGYTLDQGEPYFTANVYSRTELQGYLLDKSFVKLRASLDFHVADGDLMFYQRLILNIYFDGCLWRKK